MLIDLIGYLWCFIGVKSFNSFLRLLQFIVFFGTFLKEPKETKKRQKKQLLCCIFRKFYLGFCYGKTVEKVRKIREKILGRF